MNARRPATRILHFVALAGALLVAAPAGAKPNAPAAFCDTYPDSPLCAAGPVACTTCHVEPPVRNVFGQEIESNLLPGTPRPLSDQEFTLWLPYALGQAENADSDVDGSSNLAEILAGTLPADPSSLPAVSAPCHNGNPDWNVCGYDARWAYRKLHLDFCGASPSYAEVEWFASLRFVEQEAALDDALDVCLEGNYWRGKNGVLWDVAHRKIRPVQSIGGYDDDYNLFVWTQIDDHDAREALTADYWVLRNDTGGTVLYTTTSEKMGQTVVKDRRAGLLTTRWNLVYNVMFTAIPRTAAAQAYRAFLGTDIARMEGLYPVANEPVDFDAKGVTAAQCTVCHSTLDPLTYPFRNYSGVGPGPGGVYLPQRLEVYFAGESPIIGQTPESGVLFGQTVSNLQEWASVAANSPQFADATVKDYWRLLVGRSPLPDDSAEIQELAARFRGVHAYSVEKMLHDLVKTEAYGAP